MAKVIWFGGEFSNYYTDALSVPRTMIASQPLDAEQRLGFVISSGLDMNVKQSSMLLLHFNRVLEPRIPSDNEQLFDFMYASLGK